MENIIQKRQVILAAMLAVVLSACSGPNTVPVVILNGAPEVTQTEFRVLYIIDGDTFKVLYDNENTSVRIANIDAPERNEQGYKESRRKLMSLIYKKVVTLKCPPDRKRDRYGRVLANVTINGDDVGETMILSGLARRWVDQ